MQSLEDFSRVRRQGEGSGLNRIADASMSFLLIGAFKPGQAALMMASISSLAISMARWIYL